MDFISHCVRAHSRGIITGEHFNLVALSSNMVRCKTLHNKSVTVMVIFVNGSMETAESSSKMRYFRGRGVELVG